MDKVIQILNALKNIPKGMQYPIGIGIMIGIFFWSGGLRLFDTLDTNSHYKWEKIITDTIKVNDLFWQDSVKTLSRDFWLRARKQREYFNHREDSLKAIIKEWEINNH